jgi:hypothetical protein
MYSSPSGLDKMGRHDSGQVHRRKCTWMGLRGHQHRFRYYYPYPSSTSIGEASYVMGTKGSRLLDVWSWSFVSVGNYNEGCN